MDKLNIYEWSIKDQNCFSPYSTSYIQLWALQPNLLLCYRLISNTYTADRECCLIDLTTNQTCLINRKRLEELKPDRDSDIDLNGYGIRLPNDILALAIFPKGDEKGFLFVRGGDVQEDVHYFERYKKISLAKCYQKCLKG